MLRKKRFAIHQIKVTPDYTIYYLYRLVKPFNVGLNVFSDLDYLGVVRESGGVQAYNPRIGDYGPEQIVRNIFRGIRYLINCAD